MRHCYAPPIDRGAATAHPPVKTIGSATFSLLRQLARYLPNSRRTLQTTAAPTPLHRNAAPSVIRNRPIPQFGTRPAVRLVFLRHFCKRRFIDLDTQPRSRTRCPLCGLPICDGAATPRTNARADMGRRLLLSPSHPAINDVEANQDAHDQPPGFPGGGVSSAEM